MLMPGPVTVQRRRKGDSRMLSKWNLEASLADNQEGGLCSFSACAVPLPERGKTPGVPKFSLYLETSVFVTIHWTPADIPSCLGELQSLGLCPVPLLQQQQDVLHQCPVWLCYLDFPSRGPRNGSCWCLWMLSGSISHLQNLFPGSVLLLFLPVDEECCPFLISCLWAVQGCAVTVKTLNLNLVNHSVCCPYGSVLYSQFYFIQCQFPDFPISSNVGEL